VYKTLLANNAWPSILESGAFYYYA